MVLYPILQSTPKPIVVAEPAPPAKAATSIQKPITTATVKTLPESVFKKPAAAATTTK